MTSLSSPPLTCDMFESIYEDLKTYFLYCGWYSDSGLRMMTTVMSPSLNEQLFVGGVCYVMPFYWQMLPKSGWITTVNCKITTKGLKGIRVLGTPGRHPEEETGLPSVASKRPQD